MDYEGSLVTYVVRNNLAREAVERKLTPDLFSTKNVHKPIWEFILSFYRKYNTTPTEDVIRSEYPGWTPVVVDADFDWLCDKLRERLVYNRVNSAMKNVQIAQSDMRPYDSLRFLTELVMQLNESARQSKDTSWTASTNQRKERYLAVRDRGGLIGIPCFWESLTAVTGGMGPGQFWVIVARMGVGKTWIEMLFAYAAHKLGYRVLIFSKEMDYSEIFERLDAVFAGVPFQDLRRGQLTSTLEAKYFDRLDELATSPTDLWVISDDAGQGVTGMAAKIERYHPDLVILDGMYLLSDDKRGQNPVERLANISGDLKLLAGRYKIPLLASSQLNRDADGEKNKGDNLAHVAWGDRIAADADVMLEAYQDKAMRESVPQKLFLASIKFRQGGGLQYRRTVTWDMENMLFTEMPEDEDEDLKTVRVATPTSTPRRNQAQPQGGLF